ncbi:2'-5' RNA ligase family protein [Amaricoccus sp.]|uniref:2'-5' RNA ligase family protein n=1 Tax=Amaricoccus sp. TaxID=1872485 RepID=UPI0026343BCD|nr:2'-5' RNA ligase family protein [Amaricoccus sp.]HRO11592.1 2'-5' RNA ligase family protein [Amaricoccus sp.]
MPDQLPFPGFRPAPTTDRFLLAIRPDAEAATQAVALARDVAQEHGLTGPPIPCERLHVSLFGLAPARPLAKLVAAAGAAIDPRWPAFDLAFDRMASFGRRSNRPLVVFGDDGSGGLLDFAEALGDALEEAGLARPLPLAWTPHMTLLYDRVPLPEQAIAPIGWRVREIVLLRSLVGRGRHVLLGRWPLAG